MSDFRASVESFRRDDGTVQVSALARHLGVRRCSLQKKLRRWAVTGKLGTAPVLPGFGIKSTSATFDGTGNIRSESVKQAPLGRKTPIITKGFAIKGVSTLRDGRGRTLVEWTKTREEPSAEDAVAAIKKAFENYEPSAPARPLRDALYYEYLTLYPLPDLHLGMFGWGKETEGPDWDLKIAQREIGAAQQKVVERTTESRYAVVLVGGDATHADTNRNMTADSGHILQVDGRYDKVVEVTQQTTVRQVELCLDRHSDVEVRVLRGNHDEHTSVAIAHFLKAWYRNDPRVTVDTSPSLFWHRRFGKVMLASTHGHEAKPAQMPMIMAARYPEVWGATKHRYAHTFHVHHSAKLQDEIGGVIVETHQAPIPHDAWHAGMGYLSGRSLCSIAYDPEHGESARTRVSL